MKIKGFRVLEGVVPSKVATVRGYQIMIKKESKKGGYFSHYKYSSLYR